MDVVNEPTPLPGSGPPDGIRYPLPDGDTPQPSESWTGSTVFANPLLSLSSLIQGQARRQTIAAAASQVRVQSQNPDRFKPPDATCHKGPLFFFFFFFPHLSKSNINFLLDFFLYLDFFFACVAQLRIIHVRVHTIFGCRQSLVGE
jgi:hypothetical protein